jgi:hypothetical protein
MYRNLLYWRWRRRIDQLASEVMNEHDDRQLCARQLIVVQCHQGIELLHVLSSILHKIH